MTLSQLAPGTRVRVTQTIEQRNGDITTEVEGVVKSFRAEPTGSWFAHGKDDKLWLRRLDLQKDDGELTKLVLDERTRITILAPSPTGKGK